MRNPCEFSTGISFATTTFLDPISGSRFVFGLSFCVNQRNEVGGLPRIAGSHKRCCLRICFYATLISTFGATAIERLLMSGRHAHANIIILTVSPALVVSILLARELSCDLICGWATFGRFGGQAEADRPALLASVAQKGRAVVLLDSMCAITSCATSPRASNGAQRERHAFSWNFASREDMDLRRSLIVSQFPHHLRFRGGSTLPLPASGGYPCQDFDRAG
jgi:hypothetical protein